MDNRMKTQQGGETMEATRDFVDWTSEKQCRQVVKALQENEFTAMYCSSTREAFDYIITEAHTAKTIGLGGSRSVADLKVVEQLRKKGKDILVSKGSDMTPEQGMEIRRRQLTCDLFLCSANAVTLSGYLVNIDNTGNRDDVWPTEGGHGGRSQQDRGRHHR